MMSQLKTILKYTFPALVVSLPVQLTAAPWSYAGETGPKNWGALHESFEACERGRMQSPIDLTQANTVSDMSVEADYKTGPVTVLNNGHTIQVNFPSGSQLIRSGKAYALVQVHFHTPSEHTFDGRSYPLVAHFVHQADDSSLAVLGVLYEAGDDNSGLQAVIDAAPQSKEKSHQVLDSDEFDPLLLVPEQEPEVSLYMGSLTTPPCTEGVHWQVAKTIMKVGSGQIKALNQLMGENARPVQPINNRLVIRPE